MGFSGLNRISFVVINIKLPILIGYPIEGYLESSIPHKDPYITSYHFKIFSSMYTNFWILIVFRKTQFFHKAFLISKREFSLCNHSFLFRFECTFVSTSSVECNTEILYLMPLLRNVIPYPDYCARKIIWGYFSNCHKLFLIFSPFLYCL